MSFLIPALFILLIAALGIRKVPPDQKGVVLRLGRVLDKTIEPGWGWVWPFVEHLHLISVEPFSVSLPPQSAITKDEIPIQLQASLDALMRTPQLAPIKMDWRVFVISQLQDLMKEQLEELDFDNLDTVFPGWIRSIRDQLNQKASAVGVEITDLRISNLSPRTKPV